MGVDAQPVRETMIGDIQKRLPVLLLAACAMILFGVLVVFGAAASRERVVSVVSDDAYYYLQIARGIAGDGLSSFDGVTRTSGYHPLFAGVLAVIARIAHPGPDAFVHVMLLLNVAFHLGAACFLYAAGRRLFDRTAGLLCSLLYLANPHTSLWPVSGMEASINGLAVAAFLWALSTKDGRRPPAVALCLAAVLAVWARTDNLILVCLAAPLLWWTSPGLSAPRRLAVPAALTFVACLSLGAWMWFAWRSTGDWVQGSARIKMLLREYKTSGMTAAGALLFSLDVFWTWISKSFVKVPAMKYALLGLVFLGRPRLPASRERRALLAYLLLAPLVMGLAYSVKLTRVATWYYVPAIVCWTLAAAMLVRPMLERVPASRRAAVLGLVALLLAAEGFGYFLPKLARGRNAYQRDMLELAEWMQTNLPPDAVVGAWDSGIYSYYSGLRVINLDGLMNNDICPLMERNRPLWPEWRSKGVDSVENYELWYAGDPETYWRYWQSRGIRYIAGSTRWLNNIPAEWNGARLVARRGPDARFSRSPKALYEIVWPSAREAAP